MRKTKMSSILGSRLIGEKLKHYLTMTYLDSSQGIRLQSYFSQVQLQIDINHLTP